MQKIFIIPLAIFPAIIGLSMAFLIIKPEERLNAFIMLPVGIIGTIITQYYGAKFQKRESWQWVKTQLAAARISGLIIGVATFVIVFFNLD